MNADQGLFVPLVLGILEGLTEFLPVSSTGHLLLAGHFFGLSQPATFIVLIQLGAILAVITVYFAKLGMLIRDALTGKAYAWHFALAVILASLPAVIVGVLFREYIQQVIYESPLVICISLLIGGVVLLIVDRMPKQVRYDDIYVFPWHLALIVGLFQMLSLIPGVSRSGSTVVGAMLFGASKRSAAEFTFFIALPIMIGAFGYDLYKSRDLIDMSLGLNIAVGFAAAFVVGALVVRYLLDFVSRHGFAPFAWWRIAVGGAGLIAILVFGL
ncbi:undecaprenyl-diphosphate phosphatase [Devosia sp. YIM 151766]|uniref:undecaprenyl-diphosphate phosphatase n=1 Tax=Devosia sp. YIM 151766 TaxID=3017325 RepID=UPI00255C2FF9|nr:undecaprenyl-diphosphate phosphatase [Devosia sp. YIM 151766]WIY52945.1 undecaprenyl-diphosphate phosphatase [Devosia sp. YIM 151766]